MTSIKINATPDIQEWNTAPVAKVMFWMACRSVRLIEQRFGVSCLGAVLLILSFDLVVNQENQPLLIAGLADEAAHLATAIVGLALLETRRLSLTTLMATLAASTLIDIDHLPLVLGTDVIQNGTSRPYTHSLASPMLVICASLIWTGPLRSVMRGTALGLLLHFARDIATGGGLPLFWPIHWHAVLVPYDAYAVCLVACSLLVVGRWIVRWKGLDRLSRESA